MAVPQSYDTPIYIERKVTTQDPIYGNQVVSWQSLTGAHYIWARVQDQRPSRSEAVRTGLQVATNLTTVAIPYRDDVDSGMRVNMPTRGKIYQIVGGPAEIGRKNELEMVVEHST